MAGWRDETRRVMEACKGAFGEPVTYTPDGEDPISLTGIIDEAYEAVNPDTGSTYIESSQPMLGLKITDIDFTPNRNDQVTFRGQDFRVIDVQTDGQAGTVLILHKAES